MSSSLGFSISMTGHITRESLTVKSTNCRCSHVELTRFGNVVYVLESRLIERDAREESILVLRQPGGAICWQKVPLKPDGPLGAIGLGKNRTRLTWYGGWKVAIKPGSQESGYLYLGPFGGFRFFYHSW